MLWLAHGESVAVRVWKRASPQPASESHIATLQSLNTALSLTESAAQQIKLLAKADKFLHCSINDRLLHVSDRHWSRESHIATSSAHLLQAA